MRKDVKLGFAIGGIFLSVVIVYTLISSQAQDTPEPVQLATSAEGGSTAAPAPATPITLKPAPTLAPKPAPSPDPIASSTPIPATQPIAKAETPAADPWIALHAGMPVETRTPDPVEKTATAMTEPMRMSAAGSPTTRPEASSTPPTLDPFPAVSKSSSASQSQRTHTIQSGENFWTIAAAVYGNANHAPQLIRANPTVDPRHLKVGSVINVPSLDQPGGSEVRTSSQTTATAAGVSATPLNLASEYRVDQGDSLYTISKKLYGRADQVDKLYELNKTAIGPDKSHLKVGMVLKLPQAPIAKSQ